jgi:peroxiredoxin
MLRHTAIACATAALIGAAAPAALAQAKPKPLKAGDKAPDFTLKSWDGKKTYTLSDYRAKGDRKGSIVVVDFWCAKCPASRRADPVLSAITRDYAKQGVQFIAVDSNKLFKGKKLADYIASAKLPFPIVEDDNFTVADKFGALVTPHVFVVDRQGVIRFAGGMDNRRKPGAADYQPYLRHALDALLAGKAPSVTKARAYG